MAAADGLPILPHLSSEFYTWLWWGSETRGTLFELDDPVGAVELWVEDRLAFRTPNDNKITAVMTGDNATGSLETRAALAGGKVIHDIRLGLRRDDREFTFTLKGPQMHLQSVRLPQVVSDGEEVIYDRMHLYDELCLVLAGLYQAFAATRCGAGWDDTATEIRDWILGG